MVWAATRVRRCRLKFARPLPFARPRAGGGLGRGLRGQGPLDLGEQAIEFDGLGVEIVAAGGERLLAVARHCVRAQCDNRYVTRRRVGLEPPRRLPAVDLRQVQIHQDQIGPLGRRYCDPGGTIPGAEDLILAEHVEPQLQHVEIVLVVLDIEQPPHGGTLAHFWAFRVCPSSAPRRAISSAGGKACLERICSTPPLSRRRSSAVRSSAVTTTTGMARHAAFACSAATSSNPSISGIIRSSRITSGNSAVIASRASRPFAASRTVQPRSEDRADQFTLLLVVLDDEDGAGRARNPQARYNLDQPLAIDRFGQIPGRTERD